MKIRNEIGDIRTLQVIMVARSGSRGTVTSQQGNRSAFLNVLRIVSLLNGFYFTSKSWLSFIFSNLRICPRYLIAFTAKIDQIRRRHLCRHHIKLLSSPIQ